jgi:hypothetical protein
MDETGKTTDSTHSIPVWEMEQIVLSFITASTVLCLDAGSPFLEIEDFEVDMRSFLRGSLGKEYPFLNRERIRSRILFILGGSDYVDDFKDDCSEVSSLDFLQCVEFFIELLEILGDYHSDTDGDCNTTKATYSEFSEAGLEFNRVGDMFEIFLKQNLCLKAKRPLLRLRTQWESAISMLNHCQVDCNHQLEDDEKCTIDCFNTKGPSCDCG